MSRLRGDLSDIFDEGSGWVRFENEWKAQEGLDRRRRLYWHEEDECLAWLICRTRSNDQQYKNGSYAVCCKTLFYLSRAQELRVSRRSYVGLVEDWAYRKVLIFQTAFTIRRRLVPCRKMVGDYGSKYWWVDRDFLPTVGSKIQSARPSFLGQGLLSGYERSPLF